MINKLKKLLYFPIAYYFKFFAKIQLSIWKPIIIVVTGSSGKTTLLHLIESQFQDRARYSYQANSSYGIPFDILGLHRKDLTIGEWPYLFLLAPFKAFKKPPREKLYVVEADCDRPFEGKFLASLLKPNVTLWTNVSRTHTLNFDNLIINRHSEKLSPHSLSLRERERTKELASLRGVDRVRDVERTIAYEFGYFLEVTKTLAIVNGDSELIKEQILRSCALIKYVRDKNLKSYKVFRDYIEFNINGDFYKFSSFLPKDTSYSIQMTIALLEFLKIKPDLSFSKFMLPPGRCSKFSGIKNTTIIDSSYNATPDGVRSILMMYDLYPADKKWLVLGDMIELGDEEQEEHERLGEILMTMKLDKIILVGPRVSKYTYPKIKSAEKLTMPRDALEYLLNNLNGGEVILFKGARFLEGIIEHLLLDRNDIKKLCRREKIWQIRRKQWGL